MLEIEVPVSVSLIHAQCEECCHGVMRVKKFLLHKCDHCDYEEELEEQYPKIKYTAKEHNNAS